MQILNLFRINGEFNKERGRGADLCLCGSFFFLSSSLEIVFNKRAHTLQPPQFASKSTFFLSPSETRDDRCCNKRVSRCSGIIQKFINLIAIHVAAPLKKYRDPIFSLFCCVATLYIARKCCDPHDPCVYMLQVKQHKTHLQKNDFIHCIIISKVTSLS